MQPQLVVQIAFEPALTEQLFHAGDESTSKSHDALSSAGLTNRATTAAMRLQRLVSVAICFNPRGVIA